jgi:hypothetical protein
LAPGVDVAVAGGVGVGEGVQVATVNPVAVGKGVEVGLNVACSKALTVGVQVGGRLRKVAVEVGNSMVGGNAGGGNGLNGLSGLINIEANTNTMPINASKATMDKMFQMETFIRPPFSPQLVNVRLDYCVFCSLLSISEIKLLSKHRQALQPLPNNFVNKL